MGIQLLYVFREPSISFFFPGSSSENSLLLKVIGNALLKGVPVLSRSSTMAVSRGPELTVGDKS